MRRACFILAIAVLSKVIGAQDYQISFDIIDDDETVIDSVVVHNLAMDQMITIRGEDMLHLVASISGITDLKIPKGQLEVYPNPFSNRATIVFLNNKQGLVELSLFDMSGKIVLQRSSIQSAGKTSVEVSGLPVGGYVIQVDTETATFSEVILSNDASGRNPELNFLGSAAKHDAPVISWKSSNITAELVEMQYNEGDTLSLTAYRGELDSQIKLVPVASATISFDFRPKLEDISSSASITIEGGFIQVSDESGNMVKLTFPPGAVLDTTTVSLTLLGEFKSLPINKRQLRTFEIGPSDISLYEPVSITIDYSSPIDEIEKTAIFQVETESWLIPASAHSYKGDNMSITASTLQFGEFAEGSMTLDQVNAQFDHLLSFLGITWTSSAKSTGKKNNIFLDGSDHKKTWDGWKKMAGGFVTFFNLKHENGFYDNGETSLQEDQDKLCEKVLNKAVKEVLDKPIPDDLCDRDYTFTLASMVHDMNLLGCDAGTESARLKERFDQTLINCSSYLIINMDVNVESGGFHMLTSGVVPISTTTHIGMNASVEGTGTLEISGNAQGEGECGGPISGETAVDVAGNRDAAYTYSLTLNTYQTAVLTTICPDGSSTQTPMDGEDVMEIILSPANNFIFTREEAIEGGGIFMMEVELKNPFISLPSED